MEEGMPGSYQTQSQNGQYSLCCLAVLDTCVFECLQIKYRLWKVNLVSREAFDKDESKADSRDVVGNGLLNASLFAGSSSLDMPNMISIFLKACYAYSITSRTVGQKTLKRMLLGPKRLNAVRLWQVMYFVGV